MINPGMQCDILSIQSKVFYSILCYFIIFYSFLLYYILFYSIILFSSSISSILFRLRFSKELCFMSYSIIFYSFLFYSIIFYYILSFYFIIFYSRNVDTGSVLGQYRYSLAQSVLPKVSFFCRSGSGLLKS